MEWSKGKWRKTWQTRVEKEYRNGEERSEKRGAKIKERSRVRSSKRSDKSREDQRGRKGRPGSQDGAIVLVLQ